MNKIPYFTEDEQDVIDCLFEEYWDTPNKKIEYVRGSERVSNCPSFPPTGFRAHYIQPTGKIFSCKTK